MNQGCFSSVTNPPLKWWNIAMNAESRVAQHFADSIAAKQAAAGRVTRSIFHRSY
jgi:hypothetical protein